MALNFPPTPTLNDIHTENGLSFLYTGDVWNPVYTTDNLAEGTTNLYYTDGRVNSLLTAGDNITLTYDDNANTLTVSAGTTGNQTTISATAPASPSEGDLWIDSTTADFYVWDSAQWVELSGGGSSSGGTGGGLTIEQVDDRVAGLLVAGNNITLTYDDTANTLTIASTATGGGGGASVTVSDTAPTSPGQGDLWFDSQEANLNLNYEDEDGEQWITVGGDGVLDPFIRSDNPPDSGLYWLDTTTYRFYIRQNNAWIELG